MNYDNASHNYCVLTGYCTPHPSTRCSLCSWALGTHEVGALWSCSGGGRRRSSALWARGTAVATTVSVKCFVKQRIAFAKSFRGYSFRFIAISIVRA